MYILIFRNALIYNPFSFSKGIDIIINTFNTSIYNHRIISLSDILVEDDNIKKLQIITEKDIIILCEDEIRYFSKLINKSKIKYADMYIFKFNKLKKIEIKNKDCK